MSKTIIIQEGGDPKTLTADKLRTTLSGGGRQDWIPEDNLSFVKIVVRQNGTYKASDFGAYGITEVYVACTVRGGQASATPATVKINMPSTDVVVKVGGTGRRMQARQLSTDLSAGGLCGWVNASEITLGTKSINVDDRTYRAADDGLLGYSSVTVSGISVQRDPSNPDRIIHTDGEGTKTLTMPHYIRVEQGPLKIDYNDGEPIDPTYAIVMGYNEDGTVWSDDAHPDGVIPVSECKITPNVAKFDYTYRGPDTQATNTELWQVSSMSVSYYTPNPNQYWPNIAVWSNYPAIVTFDQTALDAQTPSPITLTYIPDKCIYVGDIDINGNSTTRDYGPACSNDEEFLALIPDGSCVPSTQTCTVSWTRADGDELLDDFIVFVETPN